MDDESYSNHGEIGRHPRPKLLVPSSRLFDRSCESVTLTTKVGQFYLLKTSVWRELYGKFLESITYEVL